MGLDMWLYKRGHTVHNEMTGKTYVEDPEEIGYWRKFNALHAYILELTNSPADTNCEPVDLSKSDVETILKTLNQVRSILEKGVKLEEDGDWYKVKYKEYTGYVSSKYIKVQEENEDTNPKPVEDPDEVIS